MPDHDNILGGSIKDEQNLFFKFEDKSLDEMRNTLPDTDYDGILVLPPLKDVLAGRYTGFYYSEKQPAPDIEMAIKNRLGEAIRDYKIKSLQLDPKQLAALDTRIELDPEPLKHGVRDGKTPR